MSRPVARSYYDALNSRDNGVSNGHGLELNLPPVLWRKARSDQVKHSKKSPLENIEVANACSNIWNGMPGDECARTCSECGLLVFNLGDKSPEESLQVLRTVDGQLPSHLYRRSDGMFMIENCPQRSGALGDLTGHLWRPSKEEIWKQLAEQMHAGFFEGGAANSGIIKASHRHWIITLDTVAKTNGRTTYNYTRFRVPFVSQDRFFFTVYPERIWSGIEKLLGVQDVQVGHKFFDEAFIIQGNNEKKLRRLFNNPKIRQRLRALEVRLELKDNEGFFGVGYPKNVDVLLCEQFGVITDVHHLENLFDLFATVIDELCAMGTASAVDPKFKVLDGF